jgi:polyisoprenyl-phosphate glycosyltransferase
MTYPTPYLSIVSPVYLAENIVDELVRRIKDEISGITSNYEIILVEDGSIDKSWQKIEENCKIDERVKGIKLSRNFGQHYAISAGLCESRGDYVVVLDCDLQDNPTYISDLLNKSLEGYEIVYTYHEIREHGKYKDFFAGLFHHIFNWLVDNDNLQSNLRIGSYSLLTRKVVEAFCRFNDYHRHYLSILRWLGFSKSYINIRHEKRYNGQTSYSFDKLVTLAIDGIVSQTDKVLRFSIFTGFLFASLGFISTILIVVRYFTTGFQAGWASISVLIVFSTGLILASLGIVGIYVGKIFEQAKGRPLYIIDERINM